MRAAESFRVPALSSYTLGLVLLVVSALAYSTAGLFTKAVVAGAWAVIFWRGLFAVLVTVAWTVRRGTFRANFLHFGVTGWSVAVVGAAGTAAFIPAFKLTSVANVALIYATAPILAALGAWFAIGERVTRRTAVGCGLAVGGVVIIVTGSVGTSSLAGDALALCMTVAMASIMVIYRAAPDTPGAGPSAMQSILLLPPALAFGAPMDVAPGEIGVLAAFGIVFALASVALAEGAKRVPSGQTALIGALETPVAPVLAFLVLFEVPSVATIAGGAVVLAGVAVSMSEPR